MVINENKLRRIIRRHLNEAMGRNFNFDDLRGKSFRFKMQYCQQNCGQQIGNGSSRMVFQIDDQWVIKLARNRKGIAQNEEEYRICTDGYGSGLAPQVDEARSDSENYEWIVAEYILPAKPQDFKEVCGVEWTDVQHFAMALRGGWGRDIDQLYRKYEDNDDATDLFNEIHEYSTNWDGCLGDVRAIRNWGMVNRSYGPTMILLDIGASMDIIKQYYR